jgi:hypothetical protein
MKRYRKFIVAILGVGLMALADVSGIELSVTAEQIYTLIMAAVTALGVYAVPNEQ